MKFSRLSIGFFLISCLATSTNLFADESGFIINGKKYITFKDGKKFEEIPKEVSRKPSSIHDETRLGQGSVCIKFQEDKAHHTICYTNCEEEHIAISCVKW